MRIGFIDYYLDEWHANNYPALIREASGGEMEVGCAYALIDSPIGGRTTDRWCADMGIERAESIEEVIGGSDALIVLSPDNAEMHEQLCQLPLRSGKPTYVDKTFAPDRATAARIFAIARASGTPCFSSSALRYASEYRDIDAGAITALCSWGPGGVDTYSIHQIEPIVMLMKSAAVSVKCVGADGWVNMTVQFECGRYATLSCYQAGSPFMMNICSSSGNQVINVKSEYFKLFIDGLVDFFRTGKPQVAHDETLNIMAIREAGIEALSRPGEWVRCR